MTAKQAWLESLHSASSSELRSKRFSLCLELLAQIILINVGVTGAVSRPAMNEEHLAEFDPARRPVHEQLIAAIRHAGFAVAVGGHALKGSIPSAAPLAIDLHVGV